MEEKTNRTWFVTLVLTMIAGYCDTITFIAAGRIFSAHVTGNFIVFAYQVVNGSDGDAWVKLLTFPVFMISVMIGGWISARSANKYFLLACQGTILIVGSFLAYALINSRHPAVNWPMYLVTMIIVFAMGLQNAFGKLFAKSTYGPTTMMTGNVTQLALDIRSVLTSGFSNAEAKAALNKGCILGAFIGKLFGLVGIIIPGLSMIICYYYTKSSESSL
jgi:uncharacterized membrane protein YoaK (UPF0700 family)